MDFASRARLRVAAVLCIAFCGTASAQQLTTPFVANSANSSVFEVLMVPPTIGQVNTAANLHVKLTSLAAVPTPQYEGNEIVDIAVDLFGTDVQRGTLIQWVEPTNESPVPPTILWNYAVMNAHPTALRNGVLAEPSAPTGISSDTSGNLFVVQSAKNPRPSGVWAFRQEDLSPLAAVPRLIDSVAGPGSSTSHVLEETVVAPRAVGVVSLGDLIVLSRDPAAVLLYPVEGIAPILADNYSCPPPPAQCADVEPTVLISGNTSVPLPGGAKPFSQLDPTGIDFYGDDLVITTGRGQILTVDISETGAPLFSPPVFSVIRTGLGNGKSRVKTGWQSGESALFVTNQNRGSLMRFRPDHSFDEVTGLQNPEGLALSAAAFESAGDCVLGDAGGSSDGLCDPSVSDDAVCNGAHCEVFAHGVRGLDGFSPPGLGVALDSDSNLLQDFCIVPADDVDDVLAYVAANRPAGSHPKIDDFCPGWGAEVNATIPPELYEPGQPLVFVKTTAPGLTLTHSLMMTIAEESNLIPGFADNPAAYDCPVYRTGWSPSKPNDLPVAIGTDGDAIFEENLVGCGSHIALGRGGSFWMMGPFPENPSLAEIRDLVVTKLVRLKMVVDAADSQDGVVAEIQGCVNVASWLFWVAQSDSDYAGVVGYLGQCESLVEGTSPGSLTSTLYNNPGGDMLWRIRNLIFTISEHWNL
jgi:hypothetical protein